MAGSRCCWFFGEGSAEKTAVKKPVTQISQNFVAGFLPVFNGKQYVVIINFQVGSDDTCGKSFFLR